MEPVVAFKIGADGGNQTRSSPEYETGVLSLNDIGVGGPGGS